MQQAGLTQQVDDMDTVEITISGKATVPAKYVPLLESFFSQSQEAFQAMADEFISYSRHAAADAGIDVDDLIAQAVREKEEAEKEAA